MITKTQKSSLTNFTIKTDLVAEKESSAPSERLLGDGKCPIDNLHTTYVAVPLLLKIEWQELG